MLKICELKMYNYAKTKQNTGTKRQMILLGLIAFNYCLCGVEKY